MTPSTTIPVVSVSDTGLTRVQIGDQHYELRRLGWWSLSRVMPVKDMDLVRALDVSAGGARP